VLDIINRYIHGYVATPVILICHKKGLFSLLDQKELFTLEEISQLLHANPGNLQVALSMFESLGWIVKKDRNHYQQILTPEIKKIILAIPDEILFLYKNPINKLLKNNFSNKKLIYLIEYILNEYCNKQLLLTDLLQGAVIVPLLLALKSRDSTDSILFSNLSSPLREKVITLFREKKWLKKNKSHIILTDAGHYMLERAYNMAVAISYAPMLNKIQDLIFGDSEKVFKYYKGHEKHIDRTLNVVGSGFQHERYFEDIDEIILSIFDNEDYQNQPKYIIDMGCGDGSLLKMIYEIIFTRSMRGANIHKFPLYMIGVDYNHKSLAATELTLDKIPHYTLLGNIVEPKKLLNDLKKLGISDPEKMLHIRSFLDHDRPYIPSTNTEEIKSRNLLSYGGAYVDSVGKVISPAEIVQSLVEHLNQWASIVSMYGLIILEVHCLSPKASAHYFDQSESFHFDALQGFSKQYLVSADVFLLAAAESGLFPQKEVSKHYPQTLPFTRITLNHFEKRIYTLHPAKIEDLTDLMTLEKKCWSAGLRLESEDILFRINQFPDGQFVVKINNKIVGVIYTQRISSTTLFKNSTFKTISKSHDIHGNIFQLIGINILPEIQDRGIGGQLLEFILLWCTLTGGFDKAVGVSRCSNYQNNPQLSLQEYIIKHNNSPEGIDSTLRFHTSHGAKITEIIPNYRPDDIENNGSGILVEYDIHHRNNLHLKIKKINSNTSASISDIVNQSIDSLLPKKHQDNFSETSPLRELGFDSLRLLELRTLLNKKFSIVLDPTFFFQHTSAKAISKYIENQHDVVHPKVNICDEIPTTNTKKDDDHLIAIIGIGCRFPGNVENTDDFWSLLSEGRDAITPVPDNRWEKPDNDLISYGGFLNDIDLFDASFFNISPREANLMDPQQRILLEVAWQSLEQAGINADKIRGTKTGIFVGFFSNDYEIISRKMHHELDVHFSTGSTESALAGRLSYFLGAEGPTISINTACSSSLVALHLACKSLRDNECEIALAAGINIILLADLTIAFSNSGMLSPDGKCRPFDEAANGYVRSEGCGVLVLKKLSRAINEGDNVITVIRGSAVNHDGETNGFTAPNKVSQAKLIHTALLDGNIDAQSVSYVETHAVGTIMGDPVEAKALSEMYGVNRSKDNPLILGSVKTNIGHTEGASGMAGLIKTALILQHKKIPANLHFSTINPLIDYGDVPIVIPTQLMSWPENTKDQRRAAVSAFGFSGTKAHVILEEFTGHPVKNTHKPKSEYLITLSAKTEFSLQHLINSLGDWLERYSDNYALEDISYTLHVGRCHFQKRCAILTNSLEDLKKSLSKIKNGETGENIFLTENFIPKQKINVILQKVIRQVIQDIRDDDSNLKSQYHSNLLALADFYTEGNDIEWELLYQVENRKKIPLPTYSFQKERYWVDTTDSSTTTSGQANILSEIPNKLHFSDKQKWHSERMPFLRNLIKTYLQEILCLNENSIINNEQSFFSLGMNSLMLMELKNKLQIIFNINLANSSMFNHTTIHELSLYLEQLLIQNVNSPTTIKLPCSNSSILSITESKNANLANSSKFKDSENNLTVEKPIITSSNVTKTTNVIEFSLFYFSSKDQPSDNNDNYHLLKAGALFADQHGFSAVWTPERHFHAFGGLFPNPSLTSAYIASITNKIRIRAGSVILPLHNPIRVAEDYALIDQLSNGRVDIGFGQGWNPNDFVLIPENYPERLNKLYEGIETIRKLWRGNKIEVLNGKQEITSICIYPRPVQSELTIWLTCSGATERFIEAGQKGFNILTALLFQSVPELEEKIKAYKKALKNSGFDPNTRKVTLMLHTFIGSDLATVKKIVKEPFIEYLKSSVDLWSSQAEFLSRKGKGDEADFFQSAFERYFNRAALIGTVETTHEMVDSLKSIGVNEIACLIDFGVDVNSVIENFDYIYKLQQSFSQTITNPIFPDVENKQFPISLEQEGLWNLAHNEPDNVSYNEINGAILALHDNLLDLNIIKNAFEFIAERHSILRTTFSKVNGKVMQIIHSKPRYDIRLIDFLDKPVGEGLRITKELALTLAEMPFDLTILPLWRILVGRIHKNNIVIYYIRHNIVMDCWSVKIINDELIQFILAYFQQINPNLPKPPIQYAEYSANEREWITDSLIQKQLSYWKTQLANIQDCAVIPTDNQRSAIQTYRGMVNRFDLTEQLTSNIEKLCKEQDVTLFMFLTSILFLLLYNESSKNDIIIGTGVSTRVSKDTQKIIGCFANTVALRIQILPTESFKQLLASVKKCSLEAYVNQDIPFSTVVEMIYPERNLSFPPLCQVMIGFQQDTMDDDLNISSFSLEPSTLDEEISRVDMTFSFERNRNYLSGKLISNGQLYKKETIVRLCDQFISIIKMVIHDLTQTIHQINIPVVIKKNNPITWVDKNLPLQNTLVEIFCRLLHKNNININENFFEMGGTSILMTRAQAELELAIGLEIPLTNFFNYPTIASLASYLMIDKNQDEIHSSSSTRSILENDDDLTQSNSIAIIGMAGRFPGANNLNEFWQNILSGKESISFFSDDELLQSGIAQSDISNHNYIKAKGIIEDADKFDAHFFNISPHEAMILDPQHRIFLECVWTALEDSGYYSEEQAGKIGVFSGSGLYSTYEKIVIENSDTATKPDNFNLALGNANDFLSTRVSYKFNFTGPSITVQTACSTALVAVSQACDNLLNHQCDMAVAGAVSAFFPIKSGYYYQEGHIFSRDGHCRSLDANASGMLFGMGVGVVILKRYTDAIRDKDSIYAVIKGTAINNDGSNKVGYTAPAKQGQTNVIAEAHNHAQVDPSTIQYVEAHATGTQLGDPIEIAALTEAFRRKTDKMCFCAIGTLKPNIGHLDAAAGVAALIKVALALKNKVIPPAINFDKPNPKIDFNNSPFYVSTELKNWKKEKSPRRAAVSAFGVGGTNVHIVLEEAEEKYLAESIPAKSYYVITFSAKTEDSLINYIKAFREFINKQLTEIAINDISYTLNVGRKHFENRYAFVVSSFTELKNILQEIIKEHTFKKILNNINNERIKTNKNILKENLRLLIINAETAANLSPIEYKTKLLTIVNLYNNGADFDWNYLYHHEETKRISLPTYSFMKETFWIPKNIPTNIQKLAVIKLHPLIDENVSTLQGESFIKSFIGNEFYITDHSVNNLKTLPGVVFLEMARAGGELAYPTRKVTSIRNITWIRPLRIICNETVKLNFHVQKSHINFSITNTKRQNTSTTDPNENHAVYVQGIIDYKDPDLLIHPDNLDLIAIKNTCTEHETHESIYSYFKALGLNYGPGFQLIREFSTTGKEALAKIELPQEIETNFSQCILHPSILDSALQVTMGILKYQSSENKYLSLPFSMGQIEIFEKIPASCFVYAKILPESEYSPFPKFMVQIVDKNGKVLIHIKDFIMRLFNEDNVKNKDGLYYFRPIWTETTPQNNNSSNQIRGPFLVFDDKNTIVKFLRKTFPTQVVIQVKSGNLFKESNHNKYEYHININNTKDYIKLFNKLEKRKIIPQKIFLLSHLSHEADITSHIINNQLTCIFYPLIYLSQVLIKQDIQEKIEFIYINKVQEYPYSLFTESLLGFARTVHLECHKLTYRVINFYNSDALIVDYILQELNCNETEVRYDKNNLRMVKFFQEISPTPLNHAIPLKIGGVYLISGGLGGLGLLFSQFLAKEFKAKLILTGRSELSKHQRVLIENLEKCGSEVIYFKSDVTKEKDVEYCISHAKVIFGHLNGVIHCAGVIIDADIINKDDKELEEVLSPKIHGTINLDRFTQSEPLDFFVMFSSLSAIYGNLGQSDYSYANAFLDAYSEHREHLRTTKLRQGKTISINWPLWVDGGMKASPESEQWLRQVFGIQLLSTEQGIHSFVSILSQDYSQVLVLAGQKNKLVTQLEKRISHQDMIPRSSSNVLPTRSENIILGHIQENLISILADVFKIKFQTIDPEIELSNYSMDSLNIIAFSNKINAYYDLELTPAIVFEHKTLKSFSRYLLNKHRESVEVKYAFRNKSPSKMLNHSDNNDLNSVFRDSDITLYPNSEMHLNEIAIIGMSGIFPGANDLNLFWENLVKQKNVITEIPKSRWNWQDYFGEITGNKTTIKWGGFIDGIEQFDAEFFNISPREAELMDPQQRLFLQIIWKTIEDAGYTPEKLSLTKTGLFVGVSSSDYNEILQHAGVSSPYVPTGNAHSILANRISYLLNLNGPSQAIDTACSSSLVAIHDAVKAIQTGDCELALVGGVNALLTPTAYISFSQAGLLSQDGQCKTFDKSADGYVRAEGVGAILLKPLSKALADKDSIYGVIKGSAVNHGGHANSLTAPNPLAQAELVVTACERASIDVDTISYIEMHGTGTALGDPIEVNGLKKAFQDLQEKQNKTLLPNYYCGLGSVKNSIGHLEAAAGIAGVIKVLLAMKNKTIPGTLNFKELNPYIEIKNSPFYIVEKTRDWKKLIDPAGNEIPRRAGISSLGFGGTNAHIIIEEVPNVFSKEMQLSKPAYIITLSAKTKEILKQKTIELDSWLQHNTDIDFSIEDISYTLNVGRVHFEKRIALVASSVTELHEALKNVIENKPTSNVLFSSQNTVKNNHQAIFSEIHKQIMKDIKIPHQLSDDEYQNKLLALADFYTLGNDLNFESLHREESNKRIHLPGYSFSKNHYWIHDTNIERQAALLEKNWRLSSHAIISKKINTGNIIILVNENTYSLAQKLFLEIPDFHIVFINTSEVYQKCSNELYLMSYQQESDGTKIAEDILKQLFSWTYILDLSDINTKSITSVPYGKISLLQRLISAKVNERSELFYFLHFTHFLQSFQSQTTNLFGAEIASLSPILGAEFSNLISRNIDIDFDLTDLTLEAFKKILLNELSQTNLESEICYRNNVRYNAYFENQLEESTKDSDHRSTSLPIKSDKIYLITGGTGGIGSILSHYLVQRGAKHLILMGMQELPDRNNWDSILLNNGDSSIKKKISSICQIEKLGVRVDVYCGSLIDTKAMKDFLANLHIHDYPNRIAGIIHCAGLILDPHTAFIHKIISHIQKICDPKINGLTVLGEIFKDDKLDFFIVFSSISSGIPALGVSISDYAMANGYMNYFVQNQVSQGNIYYRSLLWPSWKEVGMGEVKSLSYRQLGFLSLNNEEALYLLDKAFEINKPCLIPCMIDKKIFKLNNLLLSSTDTFPVSTSENSFSTISDTDTEKWLIQLFSEQLKIRLETIRSNEMFSEYGIDSLIATQLLNRINYHFKIDLPINTLIVYPTIMALANSINHIDKKISSQTDVIEKLKIYFETPSNRSSLVPRDTVEKTIVKILNTGVGLWKENLSLTAEYSNNAISQEDIKFIKINSEAIFNYIEFDKKYYPLSSSQQIMCVQSELYKNSFYQLVIPFLINTDLIMPLLKQAMNSIINKHEILRTAFPKIQHTWIQVVFPHTNTDIKYIDLSNATQSQRDIEVNTLIKLEKEKKFNLTKPRLFNLQCIKIEDRKHIFLLNIHHSIFDGLSIPIFMRELREHYENYAHQLKNYIDSPLTQYSHFTLDQFKTNKTIINSEIEWWKNNLKDAPLQCHIPCDYAVKSKDKKCSLVRFKFPDHTKNTFIDFCRKANTSLNLLILTGIYLLLHKITAQNDIIVGSVLSQRYKLEYENTIGDLTNFVPLRLVLHNNLTGSELLTLVKEISSETSVHQKLSFSHLVRHLSVSRNTSNLPLYNVFLDSINYDAFTKNTFISQFQPDEVSNTYFQFNSVMDLFFLFTQSSDLLILDCLYNESLLKKTTVEDYLNQIHELLLTLISNMNGKISEYSIIKLQSKDDLKSEKLVEKYSSTLLLLPGATGQISLFSPLIKNLKSSRSYAIKYKEPDKKSQYFTKLEDIAANLIDVIKTLPERKNPALIALSTGGIVALEIIHQLKLRGLEPIPKLILIDSPLPATMQNHHSSFQCIYNENNKLDTLLFLLNYITKFFGHIDSKNTTDEFFLLATKNMNTSQKEEYIYDHIKDNTTVNLPTLADFKKLITLTEANIFALKNYIARPYEGKDVEVNYISSSEGGDPFSIFMPSNNLMDWISPDKNHWSKLFPNSVVKYFIIPNSDHYSMFSSDHVNFINKILSHLLEL
jgi:polyketide synthase PksN